MPIYGQTLKNHLQAQSPMILIFGMLNRQLLFYKQFLNDKPVLTFTYMCMAPHRWQITPLGSDVFF